LTSTNLAGDNYLFYYGIGIDGWILNGQLSNEISKFDLDAFITAIDRVVPHSHISFNFHLWMRMITSKAVRMVILPQGSIADLDA
jgi:hypothetical protein